MMYSMSIKNILVNTANFLKRSICSFGSNERGAFAIFMGFAIIPLIGLMGISTDAARAYLVKSRISSAIDAAGLAGGRVYFEPHRDDDIRMYFNANFPANYMGSTVSGPEIIADEASETLTLKAHASVPMMFMHLFGFENVTVVAENETTRKMIALDAVLAVDMSGSMGNYVDDTTRIEAARNASNELIDILFGDSESKELLNIGVVPWNGKVNVTLNDTVFDAATTMEDPTAPFVNPIDLQNQSSVFYAANSPAPLLYAPAEDWKGCVYSRYLDDGNEFSNADTLMPAGPVRDADWMAWEPIGPEGEPAPNDGSAIRVVQAKSAGNYSDAISITLDQAPRPGNVLLAFGSRRGGSTYNVPIRWRNLLTFNANGMGQIHRTRVMAHLVEPGDGTVSLVANEAKQQGLTVMEVSGLDWNDLLDARRTTDSTHAASKSFAMNAVRTRERGALLVAVAAFEDDDLGMFEWTNDFAQVTPEAQATGDDEDLTHIVAARIADRTGNYGTTVRAQAGGPEERWGAILSFKGADICTGTVSGNECSPCLKHGITPLQSTKATIQAAIDSLLHPNGTTNITQGLGWAWRVVKPEAPFTEAVADPEYSRQQAIILLTDGQNFGGDGDGYKTVFGYGSAGRPEMDERLQKIATNIKADGVTLYVIQFANEGTDLQELLQGVASGPESPYYHYAPNTESLRKVFREIANHLSELRLSK